MGLSVPNEMPISDRRDSTPPNEAAISLLYDNIHALPHEEYGTMNFLPFAHDSEQVRTVKRHMCEAIISLLEDSGVMKAPVMASAQSMAPRVVNVTCRLCSGKLLMIPVGPDSVGVVAAGMFISRIAGLNPECPHKPITIDDHRRRMEQEFAKLDLEMDQ